MEIFRLSAFLKTQNGGNKAGVVLDCETLLEGEMQAIAKQIGYSETAFVLPSDKADMRVRFFTPLNEVDLCGHATIATYNLLRDIGRIYKGHFTQETKAGILALEVLDDVVFMEQKIPQFAETLLPEDLLGCFAETNIVDQRYPIQIVSTGLREIFIPIKNVDILHQLTPQFNEIKKISKHYNVIGIHAFALAEDADVYGRNFAPIVGIDEESATGTSSGALSCYLYHHIKPQSSYVLRQGYNMGQPSEIHSKLDISKDKITHVWVGGPAEQLKRNKVI